jgi:hypothetical protein
VFHLNSAIVAVRFFQILRIYREFAMASVVATQFFAGGKTLSRSELNQVCDILDITEPLKSDLPVGPECTYFLLLSTNSPLPKGS